MDETRTIPEHDIPVWMQQAQRRVDWGAILTMILSLGAALSFITYSDLPATNQAQHTLYQSMTFAEGLREGQLYSRWDIHANDGYGAPIPNFVPPGMPYATAIVELLFAADIILALRLTVIIAFVLAGSMTYVFVTQRVHAWAGIVAASLYVYSPYVSLTAPHQLGDMSQVLALALFPTCLWAVNRLMSRNQAPDFAYIALSSATLLVTVPTMWAAMLVLTMLVVAILKPTFNQIKNLSSSLILSLALSAFYWLPLLSDSQYVQWIYPPTAYPAPILQWHDLAISPHLLRADALNYAPQFTLGWALLIGSGLAVIALWRQPNRFQQLFFICGWGCIAAVLVAPSMTWLMGVAVFCLAIGSSAVTALLPAKSLYRDITFTVILTGIALHSIPVWLLPAPAIPLASPSPDARQAYRAEYGGSISIPPHQPVPITVQPPATEIERTGDRLEIQPPFTGIQVTILHDRSLPFRYQVNTEQASQIIVRQGYFPGWYATLDGQALSVEPAPGSGLLQIDLPANITGTLQIGMGNTPARQISWLISGLTLLLIAWVAWFRFLHTPVDYDASTLLSQRSAYIITGLMMTIAGILLVEPAQRPFRQLLPTRPQPATPYLTATDSNLSLLGYSIPQQHYAAGGRLDLQLYWQATPQPLFQHRIQLILRELATGNRFPLTTNHRPGNYPTDRWLADAIVTDQYALMLPDDLPAGSYELGVSLLRCFPTCELGRNGIFYDVNGEAIGATRTLTIIDIR